MEVFSVKSKVSEILIDLVRFESEPCLGGVQLADCLARARYCAAISHKKAIKAFDMMGNDNSAFEDCRMEYLEASRLCRVFAVRLDALKES